MCHLYGWLERIPGGTRENDGLETGIMGGLRPRHERGERARAHQYPWRARATRGTASPGSHPGPRRWEARSAASTCARPEREQCHAGTDSPDCASSAERRRCGGVTAWVTETCSTSESLQRVYSTPTASRLFLSFRCDSDVECPQATTSYNIAVSWPARRGGRQGEARRGEARRGLRRKACL